MLISHDTEFLDAVAKSILHFDHAKLVRYRGGYNDYLTQRAERLRLGNIAYERQQREAARLQGFIDRFKAKASKAKQAQSRVKALARMQVLAPLQAEAGIDIRIPSPDQVPDPLLTLEHLSAGYTDAAGNTVPILRDVTLMVRAGSRVGVLGANGAGKSTLIKTLAEELPVQAGERRASRGLAIGYFTSTSSTCWTWTARRWRTWRGWRPRRASRSCATTWAASASPATRSTARSAPCPAAKKPGWRCRSSSGKSQPAAAGRTQQPPGRGNPRGPGRRAGGVWRQHAAGLARPAPAAHHGGQFLDRGRRRRARVRRRPGGLPRLAGRAQCGRAGRGA